MTDVKITINRVRELLRRQREVRDDYGDDYDLGYTNGCNELINEMMRLLSVEEIAKAKPNKSRNDDMNEEHF